MQLGRNGDIPQHQRLQRADAVTEEGVLLTHDFARHLQDRGRPLLERLDQPVRRLESLGDEGAIVLCPRTLHQGRMIVAVDKHLGQGVRVELDEPAVFAGVGILGRPQVEIGGHGLDGFEIEGLAGARIERAQLRQHVAQVLVVDAAAAAKLAELARGDEIEIVE